MNTIFVPSLSTSFTDYSEFNIKEKIKEDIFDEDPLSFRINTEKNKI